MEDITLTTVALTGPVTAMDIGMDVTMGQTASHTTEGLTTGTTMDTPDHPMQPMAGRRVPSILIPNTEAVQDLHRLAMKESRENQPQ